MPRYQAWGLTIPWTSHILVLLMLDVPLQRGLDFHRRCLLQLVEFAMTPALQYRSPLGLDSRCSMLQSQISPPLTSASDKRLELHDSKSGRHVAVAFPDSLVATSVPGLKLDCCLQPLLVNLPLYVATYCGLDGDRRSNVPDPVAIQHLSV